MSYIHLAIPAFFALIAVELVAARLLQRDVYRLADSVADLSCGILQQLLEVFLKTALFAGYAWLYSAHRLLDLEMSVAWAWAACFLGVDFLYYWFHRWSHEVNAGWAAHAVHHQSEEYNLTVALRQGALQPAFSWVFYLPLALLGFPPAMFLAVSAFNTPSHHRVHHARNPRYIDRNHGGTLIVWDRLFGTFVEEADEPVYGVTRPLRSFDPVEANLREWVEMARLARRARRPIDKLRVLWKPPGWRPAELGGPLPPVEVDRATHARHEAGIPRATKVYVLAHFLLANLATIAFLYASAGLSPAMRLGGALGLALSLLSLGGLLDRRTWAVPLEAARLVAGGLAAALLAGSGLVAAAVLALSAASLLGLRWGLPFGDRGRLA